ncbi:type II toxin-antitoxin system VapC family toxin [Salinarimonas chemoclinalis]|uniref:type II toxin-antitoxin system VapC family toxin n=1 Tax=Salinarimonas chemoclinalis TaxID=3241599 RepID=UPI0035563204
MKLLLDTHALIWFFLGDEKLSAPARHHIEDIENAVFVSAASAWEIATKFRIGKLAGVADLVGNYQTFLDEQQMLELPVTSKHALTGGLLEADHEDPFDRLIAAQAILEGVPVVTADEAFDSLPLVRIS